MPKVLLIFIFYKKYFFSHCLYEYISKPFLNKMSGYPALFRPVKKRFNHLYSSPILFLIYPNP